MVLVRFDHWIDLFVSTPRPVLVVTLLDWRSLNSAECSLVGYTVYIYVARRHTRDVMDRYY